MSRDGYNKTHTGNLLFHLTILLLFLFSPATAGGCGALTPCGEVENRSNTPMLYTYKFADDNSGPHKCDTWNHGGGNTVKDRIVSCDQQSFGKGSRGGGSKDVDAFSFANRDYIVSVHGASSRTIKRGKWTKISNLERAICWDDAILGKLACTVDYDL
ncbi:hypothetical protein M011DRAFT_264080 [Sporormia fimetaria CBS 119925]|uniref:Uncharacterized protein n=1 Tax=Sporormia fimetaria CBS 119925 TaxID=1340428 RepID=A0A6A6UWK7_9PLEO|nr:hypothetical protein M011DRAFT_264080 [Sporormia fimetaria CBS 119925]